MGKEMLKQADDWLKSMLEIASEQKDADMIEHMKERIKIQKWLMEQAERVQELEDIIYKDARQAVLESMYEENKRYRATINAMGQILKDAIYSLDVGEKVQGLEYGVAMRDEALEGESSE